MIFQLSGFYCRSRYVLWEFWFYNDGSRGLRALHLEFVRLGLKSLACGFQTLMDKAQGPCVRCRFGAQDVREPSEHGLRLSRSLPKVTLTQGSIVKLPSKKHSQDDTDECGHRGYGPARLKRTALNLQSQDLGLRA